MSGATRPSGEVARVSPLAHALYEVIESQYALDHAETRAEFQAASVRWWDARQTLRDAAIEDVGVG